jgi:hypothetical protein
VSAVYSVESAIIILPSAGNSYIYIDLKIKAYEQSQKYKEGRFILERYHLKKENWEK